MTVSSKVARIKHQGDGTDTYSFPFRIFDAADLRVTHVDAAGTEDVLDYITDYLVTGVGEYTGGNVVLDSLTPPITEDIVIERVNDPLQLTDLKNQGNFLPISHENQLDKIVFLLQQLEELLQSNDRSNSRVPILRTKDDIGSGGYDFLGSQGKNLADPTAPQDAVTLASLGAGIVYDIIFPVVTLAEFAAIDVQTTEYELVRVWQSGVAMSWQFRCRKKDGSYEWVPGPASSPF